MSRFETPPPSRSRFTSAKVEASPNYSTPICLKTRPHGGFLSSPARGEASPSWLKAPMGRPRLDTASTVAPCGTEHTSPLATPRQGIDFISTLSPMTSPRAIGGDQSAEVAPAVQVLGLPPALTPRSPRTTVRLGDSPPPLIPHSKFPEPPLLKALKKNSVEEVRAILEQNPEAATQLFWDHKCEPPLCCAVRLQCDATIIELLRDRGANLEDKDVHGRTALDIMQQPVPDNGGHMPIRSLQQMELEMNNIFDDASMLGGNPATFPQPFAWQQQPPAPEFGMLAASQAFGPLSPLGMSIYRQQETRPCDGWQREVANVLEN